MHVTDAMYYVALHINTCGGEKYVKKGADGLYRPSSKRDRNSLVSLVQEADYSVVICNVALQAITNYLASHHRRNPLNPLLREKLASIVPVTESKCHEVALLFFMNNFNTYLNRRARPISDEDKQLLHVISDVYWKYSGGNKNIYNEWMTEFFVGTHKVIRDDDEFYLKHLEFISRNSSHYKNGEQQRHIMGSLIPEALFHEGDFAYDLKTRTIVGGKYWSELSEAQKAGKEKIHCFWIQTENTPDGPGWLDLIYHRTWDFARYVFYKHLLKSDRPQIGPYKKANGDRGLPDHTPLFIQPQIATHRAFDKHPL